MHDLDVQIREYIDATSDPLTVDDALYVTVGEAAVRPINERKVDSRWKRGWVIASVAAVAVAITLGVVPIALRSISSQPAASTIPAVPTSPSVPSVQSSERIPMDWVEASGTLPSTGAFGLSPVVSNGSSFLGTVSETTGRPTLVRSVDGVSWSEVDNPVPNFDTYPVAVGEHFILGDEASCDAFCFQWVSEDGVSWETMRSDLDGGFWVWDTRWQGASLETVLTTDPERSNGMDAFTVVVMEFDDHLIQYAKEFPNYPSTDPDANPSQTRTSFKALETFDGVTWEPLDPMPPFAPDLTKAYMDARWQWLWKCEFAVNNSQGMALLTDADGENLWTTSDGITWNRLPKPQLVEGAPTTSRCIQAVDGGWIIAPGGASLISNPGSSDPSELVSTDPGSILFSSDGITWSPVSFPEEFADFSGRLEAAGNTLFIITDTSERQRPAVLVGTFRG
jgi:hypothetical protein